MSVFMHFSSCQARQTSNGIEPSQCIQHFSSKQLPTNKCQVLFKILFLLCNLVKNCTKADRYRVRQQLSRYTIDKRSIGSRVPNPKIRVQVTTSCVNEISWAVLQWKQIQYSYRIVVAVKIVKTCGAYYYDNMTVSLSRAYIRRTKPSSKLSLQRSFNK